MNIEKTIIIPGTGATPAKNNKVVVHYTGSFEDGRIFDSSVQRGQPFSFILGVGQVIAGWDRTVAEMKIGEKCRVKIPSELAYGARGAGGIIPPHTDLIFEIELLSFN
eukprot:TRINITY_DN5340_c0_g1_i1.p1 TRINITY_DN5340_c0_g1~~TRINITY_DN5340_c0_g1_i1.p1  ORF type:complete len:117 (+),score=45.07 TRINITY_DN5340_c0_g1_i1:28-351(+)